MSREDKLREKTKTIQKLKGQVRQLRKRVDEVESELALVYSLWEDDVLAEAKANRRKKLEDKRLPMCPQCGNPGLKESYIGIWVMRRCEYCEHFDREKAE